VLGAPKRKMKHAYAFQPLTESENRTHGWRRISVPCETANITCSIPQTISKLQHAVRGQQPPRPSREYTDLIDDQSRKPLHAAEPAAAQARPISPFPLKKWSRPKEIVKRFTNWRHELRIHQRRGTRDTGHCYETAWAACQNTGEGGEDERRFKRDANGELAPLAQ